MDPLICGHNPQEKIIAVQQASDGQMRLYTRTGSGVESLDVQFYPFFFLSDPSYLEGFPSRHWIKELQGNGHYRFLCAFGRWSEMWDAVNRVLDRYNSGPGAGAVETYTEIPVLYLRPDAVGQFLIQSGRTLFKGMAFEDLHRMQISIRTYVKHGFRQSHPDRIEDRIVAVALSDNRGWEHTISGKQKAEPEMLKELVSVIHEADPDVIEGHDLYTFLLPYILRRSELLAMPFSVGRDDTPPRSFETRSTITERVADATSYEMAGRHIIDTMLLVQLYDASRRSLENYSLKASVQHFGLAAQDRVYLKTDRTTWYWDNEPELLLRSALDDVREIRQLSEILSPGYFYLTQMVPLTYSGVIRSGAAVKIESLILREYIHRRQSIPHPELKSPSGGGYTDIFSTGVLGPVIHVDIESLYPSIMLTEKIGPSSDALEVFLLLLEHLTAMRIDAKKRMKGAVDPKQKNVLDAIQSSFKILINSFYGYLGYAKALFNDPAAADRVTQKGREILGMLISSIIQLNGMVIEVDTDGVFFLPPPGTSGEEAENAFVDQLARGLPPGIHLTVGGRYRKILSYKKKNYALLGYDQKITIRGSSLISRSIEGFGRNFIRACVEHLLQGNLDAIHEFYVGLSKDIQAHRLIVADFARTETLRDSLQKYSRDVTSGQRNRTASYELALASTRTWKIGDRITYYITGSDPHARGVENAKLAEDWDPNFPDENVPYYLKRLDEFSKKFEVFFDERDFHTIFSVDDLFSFSSKGISILTRTVEKETRETAEEDTESFQIEPKIWLDEG